MMRLISDERGNVLASAILIIMAMMMIGLATISIADTQTGQSRKERERESTFNLAEGVLTSQTFVLGRNGTGSDVQPFPNQCTASSTNSLCPKPEEIASSFDGATQKDFGAGINWTTAVRDNRAAGSATGSAADFYDPTLTDSNCAASTSDHIDCYDKNGDDKLWVRATSTVRGKVRTLVALIQVERRPISMPQYAILAGSFQTSNNGRKVIVDTAGSQVSVRCTLTGSPPAPSSGSACLGYDPGKGQLDPPGSYLTQQSSAPAVTEDDLVAMEDYARGAGTYYATCPANPNGKIVYVKSGNCSYNNSAPAAPGRSVCCNSPATTSPGPGVYIIESGTLAINGNIEFHGVIYAVNKQGSSGTVVTTGGTSLIQGGVIVDGNGRVSAGSSGLNIQFDRNAFTGINTTGTAGVVQNTWRELPAD